LNNRAFIYKHGQNKFFSAIEEEKATREGFGEGLVLAGERDERIVALCADLTDTLVVAR
jgi:transketolase C-terminal domain/subunit